jgi:hypothetical protein
MILWVPPGTFPSDRMATTGAARFLQYSSHEAFQGIEISFKIPDPRITTDDQLLSGTKGQMLRPAIRPVMIVATRLAFNNGAGFGKNASGNIAFMVFVHPEHRKKGHAFHLECLRAAYPKPGLEKTENEDFIGAVYRRGCPGYLETPIPVSKLRTIRSNTTVRNLKKKDRHPP